MGVLSMGKDISMGSQSGYTVFEYLYRDGGNFKSWGAVLLKGTFREEVQNTITGCLIDGMWFVAKDVGLPDLFEGVTQWGPSDLDHPWHEMADLRAATESEINNFACYGILSELVNAFQKWDSLKQEHP
jgi:hypothetical protein